LVTVPELPRYFSAPELTYSIPPPTGLEDGTVLALVKNKHLTPPPALGAPPIPTFTPEILTVSRPSLYKRRSELLPELKPKYICLSDPDVLPITLKLAY
jgi:hypothetical protein